jgi:pyruvate kinase
MKTKIIATYGPKISKLNVLREVIISGANIIRINSKYIKVEEYDSIIKKLEKIKKSKLMIDIKDRKILNKIQLKNLKFDYLAISFAESYLEINKIRKMFPKKVKIISKIETKKGVNNLDKLIKVSDGIMIARGDLGKSISFEKIPMVQKMITKKCNQKNKMSITATELMPSMITYLRPSRAEVTDIANAILEGSEALMLSEETAIGKHPILVIKTMKKIIKETEKHKREF